MISKAQSPAPNRTQATLNWFLLRRWRGPFKTQPKRRRETQQKPRESKLFFSTPTVPNPHSWALGSAQPGPPVTNSCANVLRAPLRPRFNAEASRNNKDAFTICFCPMAEDLKRRVLSRRTRDFQISRDGSDQLRCCGVYPRISAKYGIGTGDGARSGSRSRQLRTAAAAASIPCIPAAGGRERRSNNFIADSRTRMAL